MLFSLKKYDFTLRKYQLTLQEIKTRDLHVKISGVTVEAAFQKVRREYPKYAIVNIEEACDVG